MFADFYAPLAAAKRYTVVPVCIDHAYIEVGIENDGDMRQAVACQLVDDFASDSEYGPAQEGWVACIITTHPETPAVFAELVSREDDEDHPWQLEPLEDGHAFFQDNSAELLEEATRQEVSEMETIVDEMGEDELPWEDDYV